MYPYAQFVQFYALLPHIQLIGILEAEVCCCEHVLLTVKKYPELHTWHVLFV